MKLFAKFVVGCGILLHQKFAERPNEEVDCDRQSTPLDERLAERFESGGGFSEGSADRSPEPAGSLQN